MKTSIIIASHKAYTTPYDKMYLPLHVGAEGKDPLDGFTPDNTGDNISKKNPYYCELTGMYWAWKNLDSDVIGLVHYRRYFTLQRKQYRKTHHWTDSVLTQAELESLLSMYLEQTDDIRLSYTMIAPKDLLLVPQKRKYYIESLYSHYAHTFDGHHLDLSREIIDKLCPEYLDAFDETMKQTWGYMWNMLIASRDVYDRYMSWLFPILEELEKGIDLSQLSSFEQRLFGRVSEILFNVWVNQEKSKGLLLMEIPVLHTVPENWPVKVKSFLSAKIFGKKYKASF